MYVAPPFPINYVSHFLQLGDHFFDAPTAHTCNDHPLPCSGTNASVCVSEEDAASVFAIGVLEYECVFPCPLFHRFNNSLRLTSYIWHTTQNAPTYTSLKFGASPLHFCWGTDLIGVRRRIICGAR